MTRLFSKKSLLRTDSNDPRGATFKAALRNGDYAFVEIRKGALRGGHLHDKETVQIVVKGRIRFEFVDPATRRHDDAIARPMDVLEIPARIAHLAEGLEDCIFIEPVNVGKTIEYEPQRKRITKLLKSFKTVK